MEGKGQRWDQVNAGTAVLIWLSQPSQLAAIITYDVLD